MEEKQANLILDLSRRELRIWAAQLPDEQVEHRLAQTEKAIKDHRSLARKYVGLKDGNKNDRIADKFEDALNILEAEHLSRSL